MSPEYTPLKHEVLGIRQTHGVTVFHFRKEIGENHENKQESTYTIHALRTSYYRDEWGVPVVVAKATKVVGLVARCRRAALSSYVIAER